MLGPIRRLASVLALLTVGMIFSRAAEPSHAIAADSAATAEQIEKWVKSLDSNRFVEREVATEKLITAGASAVGPIADAVSGNSLEVTTRGLYILQELALSFETEAEEAARIALGKIAESRVTSAGRRAAEILTRLAAERQNRALDELKRLGAVVTAHPSRLGLPVVGGYSVGLGDRWRGRPDDLVRLRWLRDVSELTFLGPKVTDEYLKHVTGMNGLSSLTIKRANVTDEGIEHLRGLRGVATLSLLYIPITDRSVASLKKVEAVERVRIYGVQMSAAGAKELKGGLAGTEVDYRPGGAFLGIGCHPDRQGCVIFTVRPNTAAEKGDLKVSDVIHEYEGKKVTDFKTLTTMISENAPGDTVTIKIIRGNEKLTKRITLGDWD